VQVGVRVWLLLLLLLLLLLPMWSRLCGCVRATAVRRPSSPFLSLHTSHTLHTHAHVMRVRERCSCLIPPCCLSLPHL
jgi:hypothetical protein